MQRALCHYYQHYVYTVVGHTKRHFPFYSQLFEPVGHGY